MESRLQLNHFDRRAAIVSDECLLARDHQQVEWIVVRTALAPRELRSFRRSPAPQRVEAQQPARSRIRIRAILRAPIQQSCHHPVLANPKPGTGRSQILSAHNMWMLEQGGRVSSRPLEKLIAISGDHDRIIARCPKINSQRAHPYKIGSPQASRTRPRLAPRPEREKMKVRVRIQRYARSGILAHGSSPCGIQMYTVQYKYVRSDDHPR